MSKGLFARLALSLAAGMDYIFPQRKPKPPRGIIPTKKAIPKVTKTNSCKPKRKPRKHNKKKRGY